LFLIGMRETFSDNGFDIVEMPDGKRIDAEDFSEFEKAYDVMTSTRKYWDKLQKAIQDRAGANEKALIVTEGPTDWKHMERAWNRLKERPEYACLDGKFEFLKYEPGTGSCEGKLKLKMGEASLRSMCTEFSKIRQQRKIIFVADRDVSQAVKELSENNGVKHHNNSNVYSFVLPVPDHRQSTPDICIEHYYTDAELETPLVIDNIHRRLFKESDFNAHGYGINSVQAYFCAKKGVMNPSSISIIDGNNCRVTLLSNKGEDPNFALTKMDFAEAILYGKGDFANISSENFTLIFDILKRIILPEAATTPPTELPAPGNAQQDTLPTGTAT